MTPTDPPAGARRLIGDQPPAADPADPDAPHAPGGRLETWTVTRLLEDGDSTDLRWLCGQLGEPGLCAWLERFGPRRLSRRSLAFWSMVFARPDLAPQRQPSSSPERQPALAARGELWPL